MKYLKKHWIYCVGLLGLFLIELFWSNCSRLSLLSLKEQVLVEGAQTNEQGDYGSEAFVIQDTVKNVSVQLENYGASKTEVYFTITDEGDKYEYQLPAMTVVNGVEATYYCNIYPFGKVNTIRANINVGEGNACYIDRIAINSPRPFTFHGYRFLLLVVIFSLLYWCQKSSKLLTIVCEKNNKTQWVLFAISIFLVIALGRLMIKSNPIFTESPWPHHRQYQELAEVLEKGKVALDYEPAEGVLSAENPYDTIQFLAEGIPYMMDYAYYEGHYYVYFGIIPELLLFYPYYKMTGNSLPNHNAIFVLYILFVLGVFLTIRQLIFYFRKKVPFIHSLLLSTMICLFPNYVFLLCRPDLYHIPVLAGTAFFTCSLGLFLLGLQSEKPLYRTISFLSGAFCGAAVAGCRPQFLLYEAVFLLLFFPQGIKNRKLFTKKSLWDTVSILLPYIAIACVVFWYNAARFGNGLDFGATYSLTTNDMNHRGFYLARVWEGLFSFLLQPPNLKAMFPFIFHPDLDIAFMGKDMSEFTFGGALVSFPFLWILWSAPFRQKKEMLSKHNTWKAWSVLFFSLSIVIAIFDVNSAGILQRYTVDMILGLLFAATILWIQLLSQDNAEERISNNNCLFLWSLILTGLFSFFLVFAQGDSYCLQNYHPDVFYQVASWFRF